MAFAPLLLFLGGGVGAMYVSIRNAPAAEAFRATPPCNASARPDYPSGSPCLVRSDATVESVTWSRSGRGNPLATQNVMLRLADGEHRAQVEVWFTQLREIHPGQRVAVRLDQGKITEISTRNTTFETTDSPVATSTTPRNYAIAFGAFALIVASVMGLARTQLTQLIQGVADVWRGTAKSS